MKMNDRKTITEKNLISNNNTDFVNNKRGEMRETEIETGELFYASSSRANNSESAGNHKHDCACEENDLYADYSDMSRLGTTIN